MKCPFCHSRDTVVKDSRYTENSVKRRRECLHCHSRFNTYEIYDSVPMMVIKKSGNREPFEKTKIERGVLQAVHKRPIPAEKIMKLLADVESKIYSYNVGNEIETSKIGDIVLEELKKLDDVAFIRFASIYNDFNDIETFRRELDRLSK